MFSKRTYAVRVLKILFVTINSLQKKHEPRHDKTNSDCASSEDTDQSGHPPSLIRVFAMRLMGS